MLLGRSIMVVPRTVAKEGFVDVDKEDYKDEKDEYFKSKQESQLRVIKDKWIDGYQVRSHSFPRTNNI